MGSGSPSADAGAPKRIGMIWKSWTSLAGRSPRAPGSVSRLVAMSRPAALGHARPGPRSRRRRAPRRAPRAASPAGASRIAWRCSSLRRDGERLGEGVLQGRGHGAAGGRAQFEALLQRHLGVRHLARVDQELLHLVLVRHPLDGPAACPPSPRRPAGCGAAGRGAAPCARGPLSREPKQVADDRDLDRGCRSSAGRSMRPELWRPPRTAIWPSMTLMNEVASRWLMRAGNCRRSSRTCPGRRRPSGRS